MGKKEQVPLPLVSTPRRTPGRANLKLGILGKRWKAGERVREKERKSPAQSLWFAQPLSFRSNFRSCCAFSLQQFGSKFSTFFSLSLSPSLRPASSSPALRSARLTQLLAHLFYGFFLSFFLLFSPPFSCFFTSPESVDSCYLSAARCSTSPVDPLFPPHSKSPAKTRPSAPISLVQVCARICSTCSYHIAHS